jgi:hypothetical protein
VRCEKERDKERGRDESVSAVILLNGNLLL